MPENGNEELELEQEGEDAQPELTKELIDEAVRLVHVQYGYIWASGTISNPLRGDASFTVVNPRVVGGLEERAGTALSLGSIVGEVFRGLPSPPWDDESDPLERVVYDRLERRVRSDLRIDKGGYVQRKVGHENGQPPMVLCRTYLGKDQVEAYYVTRDLRCMIADNAAYMRDAAVGAATKYGDNMAAWMERVPELAQALDRSYKAGMKKALKAGQNPVTLALEEASADAEAGEEAGE